MTLPAFRCLPLSARLLVTACVARFRKAEDPVCRTCAVGKAHARGEEPEAWPLERGGVPVVRLPTVIPDPDANVPARIRKPTRHDPAGGS